MERYIEVTGESQYTESAARFVAEIVLEVRAAKDETAYRDIAILRDEAVVLLKEAGLGDDEIYEGGQDMRRPWYWKKQVGQNAARKIILNVEDFGRLSRALDSLEVLHKERRAVTIVMRQPEFEPFDGVRTAALAEAFEDARVKAVRLSEAMGCALGRGLHAVRSGGDDVCGWRCR